MKKSLSSFSFILNILFFSGVALTGCSLYRSEGRKNLDDQARDLASNKDFITQWQCEAHSLPIQEEYQWIENEHLHWLTPSQHCISTGPLTGSNATH